jgi:pre-mRNA-processing factor 17
MNLASYSSDEEENLASAAKDAFSLSALPVAKKVRVEEVASGSTDAAPHVLSEVSHF